MLNPIVHKRTLFRSVVHIQQEINIAMRNPWFSMGNDLQTVCFHILNGLWGVQAGTKHTMHTMLTHIHKHTVAILWTHLVLICFDTKILVLVISGQELVVLLQYNMCSGVAFFLPVVVTMPLIKVKHGTCHLFII